MEHTKEYSFIIPVIFEECIDFENIRENELYLKSIGEGPRDTVEAVADWFYEADEISYIPCEDDIQRVAKDYKEWLEKNNLTR